MMNAIALRIVVVLLQVIGLCIAIPIMIGFLFYDATRRQHDNLN